MVGLEKGVLSNRQYQILLLIADGCTDKDIAAKMEISYSTVGAVVTMIFNKLDVNNRPHAVAEGFRRGLLH